MRCNNEINYGTKTKTDRKTKRNFQSDHVSSIETGIRESNHAGKSYLFPVSANRFADKKNKYSRSSEEEIIEITFLAAPENFLNRITKPLNIGSDMLWELRINEKRI